MKLPSYQETARKYVGNRYKAAKAVKAWLKASSISRIFWIRSQYSCLTPNGFGGI